MLDEQKASARGQPRKDIAAWKRQFTDILDFFEMMNTVFNLITRAGRTGLKPLAKTLSKLAG